MNKGNIQQRLTFYFEFEKRCLTFNNKETMEELIEEMENHGFGYLGSNLELRYDGYNTITTFLFGGDYFDLMNKLAYFQPLIERDLGSFEVSINMDEYSRHYEVTLTVKMTLIGHTLINSITKKLKHKDFKPNNNIIPFKF